MVKRIYEIVNIGKGAITEITPENLLPIKVPGDGSGVQTVSGSAVNNTDPENPVINTPDLKKVLLQGGREILQISDDYTLTSPDKKRLLLGVKDTYDVFSVYLNDDTFNQGDEIPIKNKDVTETIVLTILDEAVETVINYRGQDFVAGDGIEIPVWARAILVCVAPNTFTLNIIDEKFPTLENILSSGSKGFFSMSNGSILSSIDRQKTAILQSETNNIRINDDAGFKLGDELEVLNYFAADPCVLQINPTNPSGVISIYYNGRLYGQGDSIPIPLGTKALLKYVATNKFSMNIISDVKGLQSHENIADIVSENGLTDGKNFHTFFQIDGALFAGERADGASQPRFLKYPDKNDLTTFEYIQMTNAGTGVNGFEAMCYNDSDSCFYGMLSNTSKIIKIPASNISSYTITTMTDLPSGCTFAGSGGIVTDGTYLYIGTEQDPHSFVLKVRISDMTTVNSYEWSRPVIHSANISIAKGYAVFATNGNPCYALKVKLSDFTNTEYLVGGSSKTDDFALIDDDSIGYFLGGFGAENVLGGNRSMILDFDTGDTYPVNFMPNTGVYYDPNTYTVFSCSSAGFIETIDVNGINDGIINATVPQETVINSFTMRGFWINELALYWNGTSNEVYVTTWNNTTSGSIKKVELIYFPNALITREQLYYLGLMNGGSGAVVSVNGQMGAVVLDYSNVGADAAGSAATAEANAKAYADVLVVGLWNDRGSFDASGGAYPSTGGSGTAGAIKKGDVWTVSVAGTLPTSQVVEVGDVVRALTNTPGNTQANWAIQQNNIGYTAENSANKTDTMSGNTTSSTKYLSAKGIYDWAIGLFWQAVDATTSVKGIMKLFTSTGSNTDGTMTQKAITDELSAKANLASPTLTGNVSVPNQSQGDNSTKAANTAYVDAGLALKAVKSDIMILSSAYVLSNSTSLQKAFNVGSGGNGAFNASANKTYRFRCELDMTGLSGSTSAISFGFLGTATISSLSYKSNAIKAVLSNTSGGTITSIQVATISAITATSTATAAKAMITGIIRVSSAGTIIPAVATGVGNSTSQVEANSFFEITELGSDTLTASTNIS